MPLDLMSIAVVLIINRRTIRLRKLLAEHEVKKDNEQNEIYSRPNNESVSDA
jgi:hypothetical protein